MDYEDFQRKFLCFFLNVLLKKNNYALIMRTSLIFKGSGIKLLPRNNTLYTGGLKQCKQ